MNLYDRIKNAANQRKITIKDLEHMLGFSNGTINKWKTAVPYADRLLSVARFFGTTVEYLMTGVDTTSGSRNNNNILTNSINESDNAMLVINDGNNDSLTKQEIEIIATYRALGIAKQAEFIQFLLNLKSDKSE